MEGALKAVALALLLSSATFSSGFSRTLHCLPPFADSLQKTICTNDERKSHEQRLNDRFDDLLTLVGDARRQTLQEEQSSWERNRGAICSKLPEHEIGACHFRRTEDRLQAIETELAREFHREVGTVSVLGKDLPVTRRLGRTSPQRLVNQLVYRGRVLAESLHPFEVLARYGNSRAEVVVVRSTEEAHTAITGRLEEKDKARAIIRKAGEPPELWTVTLPREEVTFATNADGLFINGSEGSRIGWTPREGWKILQRPFRPEKLAPPIEVVDRPSNRDLPIASYCSEPRSPAAQALCRIEGIAELESRLHASLSRVLASVAPDVRGLVVVRHNAFLLARERVCSLDVIRDKGECLRNDIALRIKQYQTLADRQEWDEPAFRFGQKDFVLTRLPGGDSPYTEDYVLRVGSTVLLSGGLRNYEITAEDAVGDTHIAFVTRPDLGTLACHADFLFADTPGRPIRIWTLPNELGCGNLGLERERTADGYLLSMPARPSQDGVVYRWTPTAGLSVVGPTRFKPKPSTTMQRIADHDPNEFNRAQPLEIAQFYSALEKAAGPNFAFFASLLDPWGTLVTAGNPNAEFDVLVECSDNRLCYNPRNSIIAIYQRSTRKLYVAVNVGDEPCAQLGYAPPPSIETLRSYPVEYHPPREAWSAGALEALWSTACRAH